MSTKQTTKANLEQKDQAGEIDDLPVEESKQNQVKGGIGGGWAQKSVIATIP